MTQRLEYEFDIEVHRYKQDLKTTLKAKTLPFHFTRLEITIREGFLRIGISVISEKPLLTMHTFSGVRDHY